MQWEYGSQTPDNFFGKKEMLDVGLKMATIKKMVGFKGSNLGVFLVEDQTIGTRTNIYKIL